MVLDTASLLALVFRVLDDKLTSDRKNGHSLLNDGMIRGRPLNCRMINDRMTSGIVPCNLAISDAATLMLATRERLVGDLAIHNLGLCHMETGLRCINRTLTIFERPGSRK